MKISKNLLYQEAFVVAVDREDVKSLKELLDSQIKHPDEKQKDNNEALMKVDKYLTDIETW